MYDVNGNNKLTGEANYAAAWNNAFEKRDKERLLKSCVDNSTKPGKESRKSLIDILNNPKIKNRVVAALSAIIILGTSLGLIDQATRDRRAAFYISRESTSIALEARGVIKTDENGKKYIDNLDNLSKLGLDSKEDLCLCLFALEDTENYNDELNGYGAYNVNNAVAEHYTYNGVDYCISYKQALNILGLKDEELKETVIKELTKQYNNGKLEEYLIETLGSNSRGGPRR